MTIQLTPEDEKLIQERLRTGAFHSVEEIIHRALMALPAPERKQPRKNLVELFAESPLKGLDLNLERDLDYGRDIEL